jgi:RNA binding exosome subunit
MRLANNILLTVFCKEDEDSQQILNVMKGLFPFDLDSENIEVKKENALGFNEKKIVIFRIFLEKEKHINEFINKLKQELSDEQKQLLLRQLSSRLDDELYFYIRFDKEKLVMEKRLWITDSGNCFHLRMSITAFPKRREIAEKIVQEIFS